MADKDDAIAGLIAAGIITVVGVGLYAVLKSFGNYKKGDEVGEDEIRNHFDIEDNNSFKDYSSTKQSADVCDRCGAPSDGNCTWCGLPACKNCAYTDSEGNIMTHHNCND